MKVIAKIAKSVVDKGIKQTKKKKKALR